MAVVEIRGSGNKSFVFVHGMPSDRTVWYDLAELAPSDASVVLVDLPDHGEAPDDPSATFEALERAVLEAVEEAPGDEVTLVGHSVGAWLVAALSSTLPERVRRFVAICGMARYDDDAGDAPLARRAARERGDRGGHRPRDAARAALR